MAKSRKKRSRASVYSLRGLSAIPSKKQSKSLRAAIRGLEATGQTCKVYERKAGDPGGRGASGRGWKSNVVIRCAETGPGKRQYKVRTKKGSRVSKGGANEAGSSPFLIRRRNGAAKDSAVMRERRRYNRAYRLLKREQPSKVPSDLSKASWQSYLKRGDAGTKRGASRRKSSRRKKR